jgi:hypothetical protein
MMSNASSVPAVWGLTVWGIAVAMAALATAAPSEQTVKEAPADKPKPGIYFESSEPGGKTELVPLEGAMPSNSMSGMGNPFKKPKVTTTIGGDRAPRRLLTSQPVFLFVFGRASREQMMDDAMGGMNAPPPMASNPKEFVLATLVAGDAGRTVPSGAGVKLVAEPVSSGVFRVRTETPLPPGEYGFYFAKGMAAAGIVWDFGIDPAK